jgi:hypothetical protein
MRQLVIDRRQLVIDLGLVGLLVPLVAGCTHTPLTPTPPPTPATYKTPSAESLVQYLNDNAKLVSAVQSTSMDIDCKQGRDSAIGLSGQMLCQKPHNFRLRAVVMGMPEVDIGSNNGEFWYWIKRAKPNYVYHCGYRDLAKGKVNVPFPFHPDMIVAALGMAEYDPAKKYQVRESARYLELIEDAVSPQGQPVQKITVFNRMQATSASQPQVVAHVLKDARGGLICQATIHQVKKDRGTGAMLPTKVTLQWPAQQLKMTLSLYDVQAVTVDPAKAGRVFQCRELDSKYGAYDLARGTVTTPDGLRRASGTMIPRR